MDYTYKSKKLAASCESQIRPCMEGIRWAAKGWAVRRKDQARLVAIRKSMKDVMEEVLYLELSLAALMTGNCILAIKLQWGWFSGSKITALDPIHSSSLFRLTLPDFSIALFLKKLSSILFRMEQRVKYYKEWNISD